ncbi:hypothetical protein [Xanthomonas axonopodis]|uniref:hypothetical protein n=1 Tax=Xanthomonas axonopodis TaxID=53413 RepID=UPI003556638F
MEQASIMTLLQAVNAADDVSPAPAKAHEAMKRLCDALAHALCIPRGSLKAYAAELDASSIENMPAENEFVIARPAGDKQLSLLEVPQGVPPLQIGLLGYLLSIYEQTPLTLQWLADNLHNGGIDELRTALVALQTAGYVRYIEDDNALLVRSVL